jgi:DUF218 domain
VTRRLVAVLGFSDGRSELHRVAAARLRRAEGETRAGDVVLLSGWARGRGGRSEAELMAEAWRGPQVELALARDAHTTYGNARTAVETAVKIGADEIVLVTSSWHLRRAASLFRAAVRGTGIALSLVSADDAPPSGARLREVGCWVFAPVQGRLLTRRSRGIERAQGQTLGHV